MNMLNKIFVKFLQQLIGKLKGWTRVGRGYIILGKITQCFNKVTGYIMFTFHNLEWRLNKLQESEDPALSIFLMAGNNTTSSLGR